LQKASVIAIFLTLLPGTLNAGVNPDGSVSQSIPIVVPPGTAGVAPRLSLEYNSNGGNGIVGMGWQLAGLPIITRINYGGGINYDVDDAYIGPEGRLVDLNGDKSAFHPENETWTKYQGVNWVAGESGPRNWIAYDRAGNKLYYGYYIDGGVAGSRLNAAQSPGLPGVKTWAIRRVEDPNGNYYTVEYSQRNGVLYPTLITYTQGNGQSVYRTIEFTYETRTDHGTLHIAGGAEDMDQRLKWIVVRAGGVLVRKYRLDYQNGSATGRSRLTAVQEYGNNGSSTLPAQTFGWQEGGSGFDAPVQWTTGAYWNYSPFPGDYNGDGKTDVMLFDATRDTTSKGYGVVIQANPPTPDLLTSVNSGLGGTTTVTIPRLHRYQTPFVQTSILSDLQTVLPGLW
jgi:hypothetical protein